MLIDRGSREREAEEELETICEKVKEKGNYDFTEFCFLEVVPPFIEDGMEKCLKKNVDEMTIVPYFLYPCLLYTSPSPRDRQKSRMPSSA